MKKTKNILIGIGALIAPIAPVAAAISCGDNDGDPAKTIAIVVSQQTNPFFQQIIDSAKKEAQAHGYKVAAFDSGDDLSKETSNIDTIVTKGYAGVIFNPINASGSKKSAKKLKHAQIPFTLVDRSLEGTDNGNIAITSTDNIKSAEKVVNAGLAKMNISASTFEIYHLQGQSGAAAAIDRDKGFTSAYDIFKSQNSGKTFNVTTNRADWQTEKANTQISAAKTKNLKFIFAENDNMALGAVKAYESDSTYPIIVGFDGLANAKKAVDNGKMFATVEQDTAAMGKNTADIILEAILKDNSLISTIDYTKIDQADGLNGTIYKNDNWPNAK